MPSISPWRNRDRWCLPPRRWWSRGQRATTCRDRRWSSRCASDGPRRRWSECRQCLEEWIVKHSSNWDSLRVSPVIGLVHAVHRLANSSPKQSAQYGCSSRLVKRCPANGIWQWVHVKHSRCHGSFLYVTPPVVMTWKRNNLLNLLIANNFLVSPFGTSRIELRIYPRSIPRSRCPAREEWTTWCRLASCRRNSRSTSRAIGEFCIPFSWFLWREGKHIRKGKKASASPAWERREKKVSTVNFQF